MVSDPFRRYIPGLLTLFLHVSILSAQSMDREVYSAAGRSASNADLSVSYTIGESVVFTGTTPSVILSQGFEQPEPAVITGSTSAVAFMDLNAFPNPVNDLLYIHVNNSLAITNFEVEVLDVFGKNVSLQHVAGLFNNTFSINFSYYPAGVYFIRVSSPEQKFNGTFKIIKA